MKLEDIARLAGVSKATVSFAINNKPGVGEKTREKILRIAAEHGYMRGNDAQPPQQGGRFIQLLAVNTPEFPVDKNISNTFFAELIRSLENTCSKHGCSLVISIVDMASLTTGFRVPAKNSGCVGTVLLGTNLSESELEESGYHLGRFVVIDNLAEGSHLNTVAINNYQGACLAAKHLLQMGMDCIGYVRSKGRLANFDERLRGFYDTLKKHGRQLLEADILGVGQSIQEAEADFAQLLGERKGPLPNALFCESDYIAIGVMKALQKRELRIPEDISVVGFDNVPEATIMHPELTTVHVDKSIIGELAGRRLFELIENGAGPSLKVRVDTDLVLRKSTCPAQRE